VVQEVLPFLVGDLGLTLDGVEVDVVLENPGQGVVLLLDGGDGLVEHIADVVLEVLEGWDKRAFLVAIRLILIFFDPGLMPAGADGHEKGLAVGGLVFQEILDKVGLVFQVGEIITSELFALAVELVGEALEEEQAENEFLELRGVHLAPKDVGGFEKKGFELGEGDFFVGQYPASIVLQVDDESD